MDGMMCKCVILRGEELMTPYLEFGGVAGVMSHFIMNSFSSNIVQLTVINR